MTPTKLLIGQILFVFAIVALGLWTSTQWAASMLAYQPQLGAPWFTLGELPVYRPWALFGWWYHYDAYAPQVFDKAGTLAGASGFLAGGAARAPDLDERPALECDRQCGDDHRRGVRADGAPVEATDRSAASASGDGFSSRVRARERWQQI